MEGQPGVNTDELQPVFGRNHPALSGMQQDVHGHTPTQQEEGQKQKTAVSRKQSTTLSKGIGQTGQGIAAEDHHLWNTPTRQDGFMKQQQVVQAQGQTENTAKPQQHPVGVRAAASPNTEGGE
ncbi:hypothetical protein D3C87_1592730 [compost metagenome]